MKEILNAARKALADYAANEATLAAMAKTRDEIIAAGVVSQKSAHEYGEARNCTELAEAVAPVLDRRALTVINKFLQEFGSTRSDILHGWDKIDQAIIERVLDEAPESVRDGLNPQRTKRYVAEQEARSGLSFNSDPWMPNLQEPERPHIKDALSIVIDNCEYALNELARMAGVAKKLGITL